MKYLSLNSRKNFICSIKKGILNIMKQLYKRFSKFFTILFSIVFATTFAFGIFWSLSFSISFVVIGFLFFAAFLFVVSYFFFERYLYPFVLSLFSPKDTWWLSITQKLALLELYKKISGDIRSYVDFEDGVNGVSIFLYEPKGKNFYGVSPKFASRPVEIPANMLISYEMERDTQKILSVDALSSSMEKDPLYADRYEKLIEELRHLKAEVFIPLRNGRLREHFVGLIFLGKKKNNAPYTADEMASLRNIAREAKHELMYAMMYAVAEERREECGVKAVKKTEPFFAKKLWLELNKYQKIIGVYFLVMVGYWIALQYSGLKDSFWNYFFSFAFGLVPLIAGLIGCFLSKSLGYLKTVTGRALFFISLGSFFWGIGNLIWAYYNFFAQVAVPYPSFADVGFALALPFWIYGIINLAMAVGARIEFKGKKGKLSPFFISILVIVLSYYLLVIIAREGVILSDPANKIKIILDFIYPIGDAIILIFAMLIFSLTTHSLMTKYSSSIPFILSGFGVMYFADFTFSYTTTLGTFYVGNFGEFLFLVALILISFGTLGLPLEPSKYPNKVQQLDSKKEKTPHNGIFGFADLCMYILKTYLFVRFAGQARR